jgi:hypothetical protein
VLALSGTQYFIAFVKKSVNNNARLRSVPPALGKLSSLDEPSSNSGLAVADELQRKAALLTMEPVVISTNQVTGKVKRSGSCALPPES